jgi:hypothetical protein
MIEQAAKKAGMILAAMVLLVACIENATERPAANPRTPSPTASKKQGLCQPFPDRLIDDFVAAYNGRDLDGLKSLVTASQIKDLVAGGYDGTSSSFVGVDEWAETNWDAGDRIKVTGYSAFSPTKRGFQMQMSRASKALRDSGIERVSTTLDAISDGCQITSLADSGPVQAKGDPCAFYATYRTVDDVASDEPGSCVDGSGDYARTGPSALFTGERMLVWGGDRGGLFTYADIAMDGLSFDPASGRWRRIRSAPLSELRPEMSAWTGTEMIVFGSKTRPNYNVLGAAYRPGDRLWTAIEFPYKEWSGFKGVWTGRELVLWGGPDHSRRPRRRGAAYDPATGTWRRTSPAPIGGRWWHAATWTGSEMIVWGGSDAGSDLADGAAYDPVNDSWRKISPAPISARQWMSITWTGTEVIVWGGSSFSTNRADGAAYNPATDSWRTLAGSPLRGRHYHSAVWSGKEMIIFGGYNYRRSFADGAAYDPATDIWRKLARAPIKRRFNHTAIWTGEEMIVFGGSWDFGHIALGDGATYDPTADRWRRVVPDVGD